MLSSTGRSKIDIVGASARARVGHGGAGARRGGSGPPCRGKLGYVPPLPHTHTHTTTTASKGPRPLGASACP
eukprot:704847-Prymnesium_polylepis.1